MTGQQTRAPRGGSRYRGLLRAAFVAVLALLALGPDSWRSGQMIDKASAETAEETLAKWRADAERTILEAGTMPVKDAAFFLWRQKHRLDEALLPPRTPEELAIARATPMPEIMAKIKRERDEAQDGPTFDRLKRAHPKVSDRELKEAVVAAVKFEDDCFKHFDRDWTAATFWNAVEQAVARAQRDNPGYLETTYRDACNWVAYNMK